MGHEVISCNIYIWQNTNLECLFLRRGENRGKISRSKGENQQETQPWRRRQYLKEASALITMPSLPILPPSTPQMNNCSCFTKCSLQKGYFAKVVGYTTEKRWLTFHSKRRTGQAINSNSRGVPEASALAMLLRKIPMNHSREYWYMGSMLA